MPEARRWKGGLALLAAVLLAGCGLPEGQTATSMTGVYHVSVSTITDGRTLPTDLTSLGAELTLVLASDGTAAGNLVMPSTPQYGPGYSADMTGTYTVNDPVVHFTQEINTFVDNTTWTIGINSLNATPSRNGSLLSVTLRR